MQLASSSAFTSHQLLSAPAPLALVEELAPLSESDPQLAENANVEAKTRKRSTAVSVLKANVFMLRS
jgi:hypothetical protein